MGVICGRADGSTSRARRSTANALLVVASISFALILSEFGARLYHRRRAPVAEVRDDRVMAAAQAELPKGVVIVGAGESTMVGEPYDPKIDIPAIVAHDIEPLFPGIAVTPVLVARKGASVRMLLPRILATLRESPSLFILLAGHNEFLGEFSSDQECAGEPSVLRSALEHSELFRTLHRGYQRRNLDVPPSSAERRLLDRPIVCQAQWHEVLDVYRREVFTIAEACKANHVPAVFVFPAGNEVDFNPNRSQYRGPASQREHFVELYTAARTALLANRLSDAEGLLEQARGIDPHFAEVWFRLGQAYHAQGKIDLAREAYHRGKEEDVFPWRALDIQKQALIEASSRYGIPFLDAEQILRGIAPGGLLDSSVFHDIHHPNLAGYNAIATAVVKTALDRGLLAGRSSESPRFESESELCHIFDFSAADWFHVCSWRAAWLDLAAEISFDPSDRLRLLLDYVDGMKIIDPVYFEEYVNHGQYPVEGFEANVRARLEKALVRWTHGQEPALPFWAKHQPVFTRWPYFNPAEILPVHVSGVPSFIRHADLCCADGKGPDRMPLRSQGRTYSTGFAGGLNQYLIVEIGFRLDGQYRAFSNHVTIADNGTGTSGVFCRVMGDGRVLVQSEAVRWGKPPVLIRADVTGVREMRLYCCAIGETADYNDVLWLQPELSR